MYWSRLSLKFFRFPTSPRTSLPATDSTMLPLAEYTQTEACLAVVLPRISSKTTSKLAELLSPNLK